MNVFCIHSVPFNKPCDLCGREGENGVSDFMADIAIDMLWERLLVKRSYEDAKILMKMTTIKTISQLTGISESKLRKMQKKIEGEKCRPETCTQRNN